MRGAEILVLSVLIAGILVGLSAAANVSYDHRALVIDGKRRVLISGAIHYPRSTPQMWPDLIQKSKDGGLDAIETYVFWDLHEPVRNQYNFEGRNDLVKFIKTVADAGLYVILRIGPYVCAEWNYGGFPVWLHFVPGIQFRTNNEPFKAEMKRFTSKIVNMMKQEKLYASQGGPIILSQIENEYGNIQSHYGSAAKPYIDWAAAMATSLDTGVPWVMCQQADAPDPIINTCNGFYCDQFTPNSNKKPKIWTENWSGWYMPFGGRSPYRPVQDLAFAVARFYQRGGTLQNYYMYHGGTNFGRTAGGPFITTSYDYDAPIDEYGLVRQPKWGHLKDLHKAIKLCEDAMVATDPSISSLGPNLEASVYKTKSGSCAAFLANVDVQSDAEVNFGGSSYLLPAWSVSILPDCKNVVHNTAKINSLALLPIFIRQSVDENVDFLKASQSDWSWINEPVGISKSESFTKIGLLEQINTTADQSDYLWYSLITEIQGNESFLQVDSQTVLHVESLGHGVHAFVNGKFAGRKFGNSENAKVALDIPISLVHGKNTIDLLSLTVGLKNSGPFFDLAGAGVTGPVMFKLSNNDTSVELSSGQWTYQVGLKGDELGLSDGGSSEWKSRTALLKQQPLTWYKTKIDAPPGLSPVALNLTEMGKGEAWVNGQSIGRYWPTNISPINGCTDSCDYRGAYNAVKCFRHCGVPSQILYHIPRSWLKESANTLVLFEEIGGDPTQISFVTRQIRSLYSHFSGTRPLPVDVWISDKAGRNLGPTLSLQCPFHDQVISKINFASFSTPDETTGNFSHGPCNSRRALSTVRKACIGRKSCSIRVSNATFGDSCIGLTESSAVEASCSQASTL